MLLLLIILTRLLIVLSATSGGVSTISFTSIVGAPVGIASGNFTLFYSLTTRIVKTITEYNKKKKRKGMIKFLCWLKANSIALKQ